MASVAQICNMALSHIGSDARVSSINPPDGSVEAGHCATFYDQSRTELLEPGTWNFSLKRATLAQITNDSSAWLFAYTLPSDCLRALRILDAVDDQSSIAFDIEGSTLRCNQADAALVYVRDITDTTRFTPSFTAALGYMLAAYVAGPVVKGNDGMKLSDAMRQRAMALADISATAAANASSAEHGFMASQLTARL